MFLYGSIEWLYLYIKGLIITNALFYAIDYLDLDDLKAVVLGAGSICSIWPKDDKIDKVIVTHQKAQSL